METFECKKIRPCSGLIMANETKQVEFIMRNELKNPELKNNRESYKEYKKLFIESGTYLFKYRKISKFVFFGRICSNTRPALCGYKV